MSDRRGFTLIELMVVVAIIAIIASIAIPNLLSSRLSANESAAMANLRNVLSAQSQFQTQAAVDVDLDGLGEHGWMAELAGMVNLRDFTGPLAGPPLQPPVLPGALGVVNAQGHVNKAGYVFALYLPDANAVAQGEAGGGGSPATEDADLCETLWIAYAWPTTFQNSGVRAFVINQSGDLLQTDNRNGVAGPYSGTAGLGAVIPAGDAAMAGAGGTIDGPLSISNQPLPAADGNTWTAVN